jgi:hypothetical protein
MTRSLTDELRSVPPALHGEGECWGLAWRALAWLEETLRPDMATLETGAGTSTIVFAASGAVHEVITPDPAERERIERECARRDISLERVTFRIGYSHELLPRLDPRPLDLVLIDGAHGFPYPILDWWYLAPRLRVGGLVVLDDAYMPPVRVLVDSLRTQSQWEVAGAVSDRTIVVRKVAEGLPRFEWGGEPLGGRMSFGYLAPARRARAAVEHRLFATRFGRRALALAGRGPSSEGERARAGGGSR